MNFHQTSVESYRLLCDDNKDVLEEFLQRMDDTLSCSAVSKQLAKAEKEIDALEKKKSKLVDMRLEEIVDIGLYRPQSCCRWSWRHQSRPR